jgi:hypothetical protein
MLAAIGLTGAAAGAIGVQNPAPVDYLAIPLAFAAANTFEWGVHKGWMHRARWPRGFYRKHTLQHHKLYSHDDMAMKSGRELAFVLLSAPTLGIIIAASVIFALSIRPVLGANAAWMFFATESLYIVFAEVMHACYHLREDHPVRRLPWVGWWIRLLAAPHILHHDMRLMRKWNFNIGIPFADHIFRTFTLTPHPQNKEPT